MAPLRPRYRVLFIAPYPELTPVVRKAARDFAELDITVHEGDLSAGLAAALGSMDNNYDAVVSRGGTAQLLEDEFSIPVFEVRVSPADLYASLLAYNPTGDRTAIVGFDNVLAPLRDVTMFSDFDLDIHAVSFEDELPLVLQEVRDGGYKIVLCDTFSLPRCTEMGLNAHLLASGLESVAQALAEALTFCQHSRELLSREHMLANLVATQDTRFAVFAQDGRLTYCNLEQRRDELVDFMRGHLDRRADERLVVRRGHHIYRMHKVPVETDGEPYLAFGIMRSRAPSASSLVGIKQLNREEVAEHYHGSAFARTRASEALAPQILAAARGERPVLLEGEPSTGKEPVAELLYLSAGWDACPFVKVDCPLLTERSWTYLTTSSNSPLFDSEATLFLSSAQRLGNLRLRQLLDLLERSGALMRDHVVVSFTGTMAEDPETVELLYHKLRFHELEVPPLRQRRDLEEAVELLLNAESAEGGSARPTVTDEAASVFAQHDWPGNYVELTLVVQRCMARAQDGRVTADVARSAIAERQATGGRRARGAAETTGIELMRPLREIERDVVRATIERCSGNQTEAARVLGVSRTTIWRLLRQE